MARTFQLPDLGEGVHEGEVLRILVSEGDQVSEGDPILEIETDKASVEIPSPYTGTIEQIHVKQGDTVNVGDTLMTFSEGGEEGAAEEKAGKEEPRKEEAPEPPEKEEPEEDKKTETEAEEKPPRPKKGEPQEEKRPAGEKREGPVPASPATRRLARELDVDLHQVSPSGPGGRVTAEDVRSFAEGGKAKPSEEEAPEAVAPRREREKPSEARPLEAKEATLPDFTKWGEVERIPLKSIRRATAKQMALAWSRIPHVHNQDMVDMTKLEEFRRKHKEEVEQRGGKLTVTVFALKAAATALKQHPRFNASIDTGSGEMVLKHYYHIGVAVATEEGLVVPVIRDVDRKSIMELAVELNNLVERTRERKVSLEEMQGGTFSITNVGPMGGGYFSPIINYPEVAILGMGSARMEPAVRERSKDHFEVVPRLMMPIVLCIDHRILDGADALSFMRVFIEAVEDPEELFMMMT